MDPSRAGSVISKLPSIECNLLEDNFLKCLKEKAAKDDVPTMTCNVEQV